MRGIRAITAAATVATALIVAPAWAAAATVTDDSVADFGAGTGTGTWSVAPGVVQLAPTGPAANFAAGTAQPSGWATTAQSPGGGTTFADGVATVDGALLSTTGTPSLSAPQTLEFRATFGAVAFQHIGFGDTFDNAPWAMFSTGNGSASLPVGLWARTTGGTPDHAAVPSTDVNPLLPHVYRIEWGTTDVKYYVDGVLVHTATLVTPPTLPMRPAIRDLNTGGSAIKVDWIGVGPVPASGTFESRVHDAGSAGVAWETLTGTGTGVTYATRTGSTPTPDGSWSAYAAVGPAGQVTSPPGRYLQYQATLSGANPTLDKVESTNAPDTTAPTAAVSVAVSGTSGTATFTSPDPDVARFECSLDGGAFATCASPKALTGLAVGGHVMHVRAVDTAGNTGGVASKSFTIAAPPPPGGSGGTGGGGGGGTATTDTVAPAIKVATRAVRASRRGTFTMKFRCPRTERYCKLDVQIERGGLVIADKQAKIAGGTTRTLTFRLTKASRRALVRARTLKVKATVVATDATGNHARRSARFKLLAARV